MGAAEMAVLEAYTASKESQGLLRNLHRYLHLQHLPGHK